VWLGQSTRHSDLSGSDQTGGPISIRLNRKLFALAAAGFGVVTAIGLSRALTSGNVVGALIALIVLGGPCLLYVRGLFRRGSAIIVGCDALAGFRVGRTIQWADVSDVHVSQRQGAFGVHHNLVLIVRREGQPPVEDSIGLLTSRVQTETVEFSIDQLAIPSSEIVALVQERLGRNVATKRETWISAVRAK
jgi:hypothetical protein